MRYILLTIAAAAMAICGARVGIAHQERDPSQEPATSQPVFVDVSDKSAVDAAMNKDVFLEGVVESAAWATSGKVMRIEFKGAGESKVHAVIFEKKRADFDAAFGGDVAKALVGARVRISGRLKDYKGRPEVVIDQLSQLTILDEAPSTTKPS